MKKGNSPLTEVMESTMSLMEYERWLDEVKAALDSVNMPMADWQGVYRFDFHAEYEAGAKPDDAAMKANRCWWREQNKSLKQDCREREGCWLPRGHRGECQPVSDAVSSPSYQPGDYVKIQTTFTYAPLFPGITVAAAFAGQITRTAMMRLA